MHRLGRTDAIPGEAAQLLPLPRHFEEVADLIGVDQISAPCGPALRHILKLTGTDQLLNTDPTMYAAQDTAGHWTSSPPCTDARETLPSWVTKLRAAASDLLHLRAGPRQGSPPTPARNAASPAG